MPILPTNVLFGRVELGSTATVGGCHKVYVRKCNGAKSPVTTSSDQLSSLDRGLISSLRSSMPRSEYFAALCIVGCANGIISRVMQAVAGHGWVEAVLSTFEISVIVWIAGVIGIGLVLKDIGDRISATDLAVGAMFLFLAVLPGAGELARADGAEPLHAAAFRGLVIKTTRRDDPARLDSPNAVEPASFQMLLRNHSGY